MQEGALLRSSDCPAQSPPDRYSRVSLDISIFPRFQRSYFHQLKRSGDSRAVAYNYCTILIDETSVKRLLAMQAADALGLDPESIQNLGPEVLQQVLLGHFMVDYWVNLAVCHSLIVEDHPSLGKVYQVTSTSPVCSPCKNFAPLQCGCLYVDSLWFLQ